MLKKYQATVLSMHKKLKELAEKFEAGENDINKAYKKVALACHPDKLGDKYDEKAKKLWLKI